MLDFPGITKANVSALDFASGPELVEALGEHAHPVSNLVWADRHGSIGYKTVGRLPVRPGGCPDLPRPGWTAEHDWDGWVHYDELPEARDPENGFLVTANNRIAPEDYPHHITSDYLDGYRAERIEELIAATPEHDLESFEMMQTDMLSVPGLETARRLARLRPRDQRERAAIERLRSWDGRMTPGSIAATVYQAFTLRLGREVTRAAIEDRDLSERWLDRADNGFIAHVTSPWRWQSHLLALWEEADEGLVGRPWDELALDALRGGLDDLESKLGPDPDQWRWGKVHPLVFGHALGAASPLTGRIFNRRLEVGGGQETVAQVGWDPNDPFTAIWAPCWRMVADPARPERSRWQAFTGQSGHVASPHYDDLQVDWLDGRTQPMSGEGPWRRLELLRSSSSTRGPQVGDILVFDSGGRGVRARMTGRRAEIQLEPDEQRELIESERVVVVSTLGRDGWPHSMPLWYVPREGEIWIYTYAKSQKVRNLERDPRATLLIETGHEYGELRGVEIEAVAEIHHDPDTVYELALELTARYSGNAAAVDEAAADALRAQARKRVAVRFEPRRVATWDHRKLAGAY